MERVTVDGIEVAYRRVGAGPSLVLLHGGVCDSRTWLHEMAAWAPDLDVVAWDWPGCGASEDPPPSWLMPDFAECLAGFLDAVGMSRPCVVGHSLGSSLAIELALRHPGRAGSLVLAGPYAGWAGSLPPDEVQRRVEFAESVATQVEHGGWDPTTMPGLFSADTPPERLAERVASMSEIRAAGTRITLRAMAACDQSAELHRIGVPTLVLAGRQDERSSPSVAEAIHAAIPVSELVWIDPAGHELFADAGPRCIDEVRRFALAHA